MKHCTKCGEYKAFTAFFADKSRPDGYLRMCIPCKKVIDKAQYQRNKARALAKNKEYARENPEICNRAKRKYRIRNKEYYYAKTHTYNAQKRSAHVKWDRELTDLAITEATNLAYKRKVAFGFSWEIDHILPLQGKYVCGLHVWNNIQVIPRSHNRRKRNIFIPT